MLLYINEQREKKKGVKALL